MLCLFPVGFKSDRMAEKLPETYIQQMAAEEETKEGGPPPLSHGVPPPQDMDRSKLDWLLRIIEDYFKEQLKTVVSKFIPMRSYPFFYPTGSTYTVKQGRSDNSTNFSTIFTTNFSTIFTTVLSSLL